MSKKSRALSHNQFKHILDTFRVQKDTRMELLCLLLAKCIRIGDTLDTIRKGHIWTDGGQLRDRLLFYEQKTGKHRNIPLKGTYLQAVLHNYYPMIEDLPEYERLFYNNAGSVLKSNGVRFILRQFVGQEGIEQCSPHSFRKYGAKYMHDHGIDIEVISQVLNHASVRETRTYLDIQQKEIEKALEVLNY